MTDTKKATETEQKQQFKVSVGMQVSTPFGVGAGVKHEQETGHAESTSKTDETKTESNVFEATGGDTILAGK